MLAPARIATAAQIDQSYLPGGANMHSHLICDSLYAAPNDISIGSAVFAGLTHVPNTQTWTYAASYKY